MPTALNPYLSFRTTARAAMEHYRSVFGGDLVVSTFKEFQASQDPSEDDLVMHSRLMTPGGFVLMASDTPERMALTVGTSVSISLGGDDVEALERWWEGLAEGATVTTPLAASPWGDRFGMLTDRFGVHWLVNIAAAPAGD